MPFAMWFWKEAGRPVLLAFCSQEEDVWHLPRQLSAARVGPQAVDLWREASGASGGMEKYGEFVV